MTLAEDQNPYIDPKLKRVWEQGYNAACQQKDEEIAALKNVLRFADCPELIIENPKFIIGKKPTDEDMEWARGKANEYIAKEESKDQKIARLKSTLQLVKAILSIHQNRDSNLDALLSKVTESLKPIIP